MALLPTTPSTEPKRVNPKHLVIFGSQGVGKSSFAASLPNTLIIDTERSTQFLKGIMVVDVERDNKKFNAVLKEIAALEKNPYKYCVIDTLDGLLQSIIYPYVCNRHGKTSIADFDFGAGYTEAKELLFQYMQFLEKHFEAIIWLAHQKRTIIGETDVKLDTTMLNLPNSIRIFFVHEVDDIARMIIEEGERKLIFSSSENTDGKSRAPHLNNANIDLDWSKIFV